MNDIQTEQLTKYRALSGVFTNHEAKIDKLPKLKEKVGLFKAYLLSINKEAINSGNDVAGITASKEETKIAMAELATELAAGAKAYAHEQGDAKLLASFSVSLTDIQYAKNADALNVTNLLLKALTTHQEALEEFFITAEDISELQELADLFEELEEDKGSTQAGNKTANRKLKQLFSETQTLLAEQLDRLMKRLQRKEPDLVRDYFNARGTAYDPNSGSATLPTEGPTEQ